MEEEERTKSKERRGDRGDGDWMGKGWVWADKSAAER